MLDLRRQALPFVLALAAMAGSCKFRLDVPTDSGTAFEVESHSDTPKAEKALLWVSYQVEVLTIDGGDVGLAAAEDGLYYRVKIDPGTHRVAVRLNYTGPTQRIVSEAVELDVELEAGATYRLLDLAAGAEFERRFDPRLVPGEPAR